MNNSDPSRHAWILQIKDAEWIPKFRGPLHNIWCHYSVSIEEEHSHDSIDKSLPFRRVAISKHSIVWESNMHSGLACLLVHIVRWFVLLTFLSCNRCFHKWKFMVPKTTNYFRWLHVMLIFRSFVNSNAPLYPLRHSCKFHLNKIITHLGWMKQAGWAYGDSILPNDQNWQFFLIKKQRHGNTTTQAPHDILPSSSSFLVSCAESHLQKSSSDLWKVGMEWSEGWTCFSCILTTWKGWSGGHEGYCIQLGGCEIVHMVETGQADTSYRIYNL